MHAYDAEIKRLRDEAAVLEQKLDDAIAKGCAFAKHDIAAQMLADNIPIDFIQKYTGLTKDEIEHK